MKFMIINEYGAYSIEAENFDEALYKACNSCGEDALIAIIRIDLENE